MATLQEIRAELDSDPVTYGAMSDAEALAALLAISNTVQRESISGAEMFGYTDPTEYAALTDSQKQQWLGICGIDNLTKDAVPLVQSIFNNTTTTWANIVKTVDVFPFAGINEGDIKHARAS